jgi:D-arabinose 1-dehydrogenase-like Zn-dependent alcohol dehydrogenase
VQFQYGPLAFARGAAAIPAAPAKIAAATRRGFYARGLIHPTVKSASLDDINEVFGRMERGQIDGRVVIDYR